LIATLSATPRLVIAEYVSLMDQLQGTAATTPASMWDLTTNIGAIRAA
jgi:hypothetical protein